MQRNTATPMLALLAIGVVFGDIGTSPIYAFQQSVSDGQASASGILGVASLIFWALTIVVSVKYLLFVLRADNHGEGGVLALFALQPKSIREPDRWRGYVLFFALLLGTAFLFGDGLITPAISVLSAIEGTAVIHPSWVHFEVPVTCVILIGLFAVQRKGTRTIGTLFGPIMVIWFFTIGALGIREVARYPKVLEAISPKYALDFLAHNQFHSLVILSSVILAITGVEALYADLGHFGARAIRWAWFVIVAPSLVMNYLGQAAEEIVSPRSANALFFNMAPNRAWLVYLVLLSTAATIIASQALISGVASISQQAIHLGIFPRLNIIHTSDSEFGQVYVPFMNALLGIGTILLVVIFKSSAHLANAYSFDISGTMLITTIGLGIVAVHRWHWGKYRSLLLCAFFGVIDLAFFASTSTKLLKGAWVPLLIALVILYFMIVWRHSNNVLTRQLKQSSIPLSEFTATCTKFNVAFTDSVGVYLTTDVESIPQAALTQIRQLHALPSSIFLVSVVTSEDPYGVSIVANYEANDLVSVLVVKVGYMESVDLPELLRSDVLGTRELAATYYLADRKFNNRNLGEITGVEESIFTFLHRNAVTASHYFGLPDDRVVTLAMQLDL